MSAVQEPEFLTRREVAQYLTENGFRISKSTLDRLAVNHAGPKPAGTWGNRQLYRPSQALKWARARFKGAPQTLRSVGLVLRDAETQDG